MEWVKGYPIREVNGHDILYISLRDISATERNTLLLKPISYVQNP